MGADELQRRLHLPATADLAHADGPRVAEPATAREDIRGHGDPLPVHSSHAQKEIETLEKQLHDEWQEGIEVVTLTKSEVTGKKLNDERRRGKLDVIHYAGHTSFDEVSPDLNGLLKGKDSGNSEVFFAQKVRRLLKGKPLVS